MLKKYLFTFITCLFSITSISNEVSYEEMVNFIVKEQVISQQEQTMRDSMNSMLMMLGMEIEGDELNEAVPAFVKGALKLASMAGGKLSKIPKFASIAGKKFSKMPTKQKMAIYNQLLDLIDIDFYLIK